ncbi:MAG: kelch repeat-containing protein [Planctomycetota bacterium]|nr:kelch repeat-containing protein [Planctomycetota bacterium]
MHHLRPTLPVLAAALLAVSIDARLVAQGPWTQVVTTGPSARYTHAMAYDSQRGVTVLFGGREAGFNELDDTWEWDGTSWTQIASTGPSPRARHTMAYDSQRGVTVLFGGRNPSFNPIGDTWEWDGNTWTQVASTGPAARYAHAMAYDSQRGVTVLFGGWIGSGALGNTWEWDGNTWTQVASTGPTARAYLTMNYDSQRGACVVFGGFESNFDILGDTWEWNGTTWTQAANSGPIPRYDHMMCYDSLAGVSVLFGGESNSGLLSDTWEWDGNSWTQPAITGPPGRWGHQMAYDRQRGLSVLFGGQDSTGPTLGDTWEYREPVPSGVALYGSGCGSPPLSFLPINTPTLGSVAKCVMGPVPAPYLGAVAAGFSNSSANGVPLPFELTSLGLPGCFQSTSEEANPLLVSAGVTPGVLQFQLTIPNDPSWLSFKLYLQSYCLAPSANALGAITSNGIEWTIGDY